MIKITRFFYVNILCIPLFAVAYFTNSLQTLMFGYSVVMVHEIFHLIASLLLNVKVKSIIVMPFGMTVRLAESIIKNPIKEAIIALSGPFANVLMIVLAKMLQGVYTWSEESFFFFIYLNYITLAINLLPCMPLDGGRVLRAFLVGRIGYINTVSVQRKIGKRITTFMMIAGVLLLIITRFNMSLVLTAAFLAFNMINEEKQSDYIIMKELLYTKDKLKAKKIMNTKFLSTDETARPTDILRKISYDSFYVINVIKDGQIKRTMTETEFISDLKQMR